MPRVREGRRRARPVRGRPIAESRLTTHVSALDPLEDERWSDLLARHPHASVFHSRGWLDALKRTYGYEPMILTTTSRGALANGLAFCAVRTGIARRLVSLPFSDHCEPLVERSEDLAAVLAHLAEEIRDRRWDAVEVRPRSAVPAGLSRHSSYCLHVLDLTRSVGELFNRLHHSCARRAIRRAEREHLTYEVGTSDRLFAGFYGLLRVTRRRQGLPPQPVSWFRNLLACLPGAVAIRTVSKGDVPVASILTLSSKKTLTYKYGGSDATYHRLGSVPFLFWQTIQDARSLGFEELDLGRSALDQPGLLAFKDHLGATRTPLTYYTSPGRRAGIVHSSFVSRLARRCVPYLPDAALDLTGRLFYRHLG
jgi:CelD/BcsL family acetyltransferase involved in cellulose biosynthesis